ncbi:MAG TPA: hypothetical protein VMG61_13835 [Usitatibacter sp.]|nr:hypothetical protein [Usitatibacter sp.]
MSGARLWAVTCFFNPQGYRRRVANFREFRARLAAPLIAVELAFDREFTLSDSDAERVVRVRGGDVMWQKERLLNVGIGHLPAECEAVAMLDCDIVFGRSDWPREAELALERAHAVHLFRDAYFLRPGMERTLDNRGSSAQRSCVAGFREGRGPAELLAASGTDGRGAYSPGLAWAARREWLEEHGLFDRCVIGGGDTALACALLGFPEVVESRHRMNEAQRHCYREWAEPLSARVGGDVASLEGDLYHLWHGELADRRAACRHQALAAHAFDPYADVAADEHGAWRWASAKPEMHALLRRYFAERREDG